MSAYLHAVNIAKALFSVSLNSLRGLLSATIPAPACTYIWFSLISAVLSAMQVLIFPLFEIYPTEPA